MKVKLKNIAELQAGLHIKSSEYNKSHKAFFIGLRDFDEEGNFLYSSPKVDPKKVKEKYFIKENEILFSTKMKFNAICLPHSGKELYVASNSFAIIKPNNNISTNYLKWYLNHPTTQAQLTIISQGQSRIPYLSLKQLEDIDIILPKVELQKKIEKIEELYQREKALLNQLIIKKDTYLQTLLFNTINHE